jgi:hypothetical protein
MSDIKAVKCKDCGGEVEPAIQETIDEANEYFLKLGKEANIKPTCGDCLALMFGEAVIN